MTNLQLYKNYITPSIPLGVLFPLYWFFTRDPYETFMKQSLFNWVRLHPQQIPPFVHCSPVTTSCDLASKGPNHQSTDGHDPWRKKCHCGRVTKAPAWAMSGTMSFLGEICVFRLRKITDFFKDQHDSTNGSHSRIWHCESQEMLCLFQKLMSSYCMLNFSDVVLDHLMWLGKALHKTVAQLSNEKNLVVYFL